ncbi:MAG: TolC family outer membrane protein, partial [Bradyrhizobiaceae bacterium]|nr:TolC family outer membrane protein [Bradyrhizobiaceae bacterium]
RADTLLGALANAYQNNPQLNSQRAVVRATDEQVPQALSGYKPSISATATVGEQYSSTLTKGVGLTGAPVYTRNSNLVANPTVGITATQNLFDGFQTANRVRQAETNTSAAREALRVAEQTILSQAATAYMDLLRDSALLELQRRNVEVLQEQLRQTRDRFNVGEVTRTDVAQTEAQLAQGRATVLAAESQYARSRAVYRQAIGVEAGALQAGAPVDRLVPPRLAEAIEIARARHPSVGVAMFGIDAALLQVKITEGTLYPQARLVGGATQSWEPIPGQEVQLFNAFVQGQVTIPIYNAGPNGPADTYSAIRQAKEAVGQKRMDLDTARDLAQANVVTSWGALDAAKAQILATQAQVASSEIALNGIREEARVGQRTTFDILVAQQNLVNARTALVTAQHDRVVASYNLLAAVGELNLPKLGIDLPLYDPMVHYQQVRDAWFGVRTPDGR